MKREVTMSISCSENYIAANTDTVSIQVLIHFMLQSVIMIWYQVGSHNDELSFWSCDQVVRVVSNEGEEPACFQARWAMTWRSVINPVFRLKRERREKRRTAQAMCRLCWASGGGWVVREDRSLGRGRRRTQRLCRRSPEGAGFLERTWVLIEGLIPYRSQVTCSVHCIDRYEWSIERML